MFLWIFTSQILFLGSCDGVNGILLLVERTQILSKDCNKEFKLCQVLKKKKCSQRMNKKLQITSKNYFKEFDFYQKIIEKS